MPDKSDTWIIQEQKRQLEKHGLWAEGVFLQQRSETGTCGQGHKEEKHKHYHKDKIKGEVRIDGEIQLKRWRRRRRRGMAEVEDGVL